jgi:hypothetical protein
MNHSEFHFEKVEDLPDEAYWHALEELEKRRLQWLRATKTFHNDLNRLRKEYLAEFYAIIGEENLPRYLRLHKRRIRNMRSMRERIPKTREGLLQLEAKRRRNITGTAKLVERAGIDVSRIKALQMEFNEKTAAVLEDRIGTSKGVPPPRTQELRGGEEIILSPPYFWGDRPYCDRDSTKGRNSYEYDRDCDRTTGMMNYMSTININDAGDSEDAHVICLTKVGTVARVPSDCETVQIMAFFENIRSHARGSGSDECGTSSYQVFNHITADFDVAGYWPEKGKPYYHRSVSLKGEHGGDGNFSTTSGSEPGGGYIHGWSFDFWQPGETVYSHLLDFPGPYKRGDWLEIWVGLIFANSVYVNDYAIDDLLRYELKLNRILLNFK